MTKEIGFLLFLLGIIFLEMFYSITVKNDLSDKGWIYADAQIQLQKQETENSILETEILKKSALTNIQQEARGQGFIPATDIYLNGE